MSARGWVAMAAGTVVVFAAGARDGRRVERVETLCELSTADRARTSSYRCIACHDGAAGPGVEFRMSANDLGMSHPVEVDYGLATLRYPGRYAQERELPPDVPLVGGRVACTSCHDGASKEPKRVANPMKLCYACHRM